MKNFDELTNDLLRRRDRYIADRQIKRKKALRITVPICGMCLVVLLGFTAWKIGEQSTANLHDKDGAHMSSNDPSLSTHTLIDLPEPSVSDDPCRIMWTLNKAERIAAAKLNFEPDEYYREKKSLFAVADYLGQDLSNMVDIMPEGFAFVGLQEMDFFYKNDGTLVHDSCHFLYKKGEQEILIHASKIGVPYDYMYVMQNTSLSKINGVELVIGCIYSEEDPEEFDVVFADFSHGGIQYRVTLENVPFDGYIDFEGYLACIVAELTK